MLRESDIAYERGSYWIKRKISRDAAVAPLGSVYYQAFRSGLTHSTATGYVTASYERAKRYCDRMASCSGEAAPVTQAGEAVR